MPEPGRLIGNIPLQDRPRERLMRLGAAALTDVELVAVLLRCGQPGRSALDLAGQILEDYGGLSGLLGMNPKSLLRYHLRAAKVCSVMAAIEIGGRLARRELPGRRLLSKPLEVVRYLGLRYCQNDQEIMGALMLDTRHGLKAEREIFRGTLNRAAVEPRQILKECLLESAAACILFHTHPSGDPSPSAEDLLFTRRMVEAGEIVGVEIVDHLIVGAAGRWTSMRQRMAW